MEQQQRLYRSRKERILGGVCGGVAEYFNVDPALVRLVWLLFILPGGAGFFAYLIAWLIIPERPLPASQATVEGEWSWVEEPQEGQTGANRAGGDNDARTPGTEREGESGTPGAYTPESGAASESDRPGEPEQPGRQGETRRRGKAEPTSRQDGRRQAGIILILLGAIFFLRQFFPWFSWGLVWPAILIVIGAALMLRD